MRSACGSLTILDLVIIVKTSCSDINLQPLDWYLLSYYVMEKTCVVTIDFFIKLNRDEGSVCNMQLLYILIKGFNGYVFALSCLLVYLLSFVYA